MTYVAAEADFDSAAESDAQNEAADARLPWPGASAEVAEAEPAPASGSFAADISGPTRSEDWIAGDAPFEIESAFGALLENAEAEALRLKNDCHAERSTAPLAALIALARDARLSGLNPADHDDVLRLLARLLREAISNAEWDQARLALAELQGISAGGWDSGPLLEELAHPESVLTRRLIRTLDARGLSEIQSFLEIARALGTSASDWLMTVLAKSEQRRTRQSVAKALAALCREDPERLAPWALDERWFVVRNVVHVLGLIGGTAIVGLLRPLVRHPEPRVGIEIVRALEPLELEHSRPLLLELLPGADTRVFGAVLHRLASKRDPEIARLVHGWLRVPEFHQRPPEQQRGIYSALGSCGGDELLPELEAELLATKWFDAKHTAHCQSLARAIARFGTPASCAVLERGATSRSAPAREACRAALQSIGRG
jgi:hypothetical protein